MADRILAANTKRDDQQALPADVRPALEKLVAARRDLYVQLHDSLVTRIAQLAELNGAERDLLNQTTQLRALLNSRLLWLPSSGSIGIGWLDQVRASFGWIGRSSRPGRPRPRRSSRAPSTDRSDRARAGRLRRARRVLAPPVQASGDHRARPSVAILPTTTCARPRRC